MFDPDQVHFDDSHWLGKYRCPLPTGFFSGTAVNVVLDPDAHPGNDRLLLQNVFARGLGKPCGEGVSE